MSPLAKFLVTATVVSLAPVASNARAYTVDDAKEYCARLTNAYKHFVGSPDFSGEQNRDAIGGDAVAECNQGHYAKGIPVLEQKVANAKMPLPARPRDLAEAVR